MLCYHHSERKATSLAIGLVARRFPAGRGTNRSTLCQARGGSVNQTRITSGRTAPPLPDLIHQLRAQRIRISALSRKSGALRVRGRDLLAKSKSLAACVEQSWANLAIACLDTRSAVAEFRLHRSARHRRTPVPKPSPSVPELVLADSPDMVEALEQATEILKMEFSGTEGTGLDALVKCEKVLQRTRSTCTIELPLY